MKKEKVRQKRLEFNFFLNFFIISSMICFVPSAMHGKTFDGQQESTISRWEYRIGAMDLLEIAVIELPELNQTVRVSDDGAIRLSLIGRVDAAGLTALELEQKLASILNQQYTKEAHVTVFIQEYQKVAILGAVVNPGMYQLVGPTTLLQLIAQAGGLSAQAMDEAYINRQAEGGQQARISVNLEELMTTGNRDVNIELQPKDMITIPMARTLNVYVYGEVQNPGAVEYMSNKKITLLRAITQAGGTTAWAKKKRVMVKRTDKTTGIETNIRVNLIHVIKGKSEDIILEEGDIVIVP